MTRLVALAIALCLACAMLTGVVVAIGRQTPIDHALAGLHLTDCAPPCWIGIEPGKTPMRQAIAQVHAVYDNDKTPGYTAIYDKTVPGRLRLTLHNKDNPALSAQISLDNHELREDQPVLMITMNFAAINSYPFTLAELVSLLGDPHHVYLIGGAGNNSYYMSLNYGDNLNRGIVIVLRANGRVDWQQSAEWMRLQDLGSLSRSRLEGKGSMWFVPWRGFTTLSRYYGIQ
jgi:hypothetical protein